MLISIRRKFLEKTDGKDLNQYLSAFSAGIAFFNAGVHFGWTVPSLPKLITGDVYDISEDEASYIAMVGSVGHVIGGLGGSFLIDRIGRKKSILAIAVPQFLGFLLTYFSIFGKYWFFPARIIGGIGEGAAIALVPSYASEVTEPELRGNIGTVIGIFFPTGGIVTTLMGSYLDIPTAALISLIFPVIFFLCFSIMPESPYYHLMKKDTNQAEYSLKILRRKDKVEKELLSLIIDVDRQMSETGTYKDLFAIMANRKAFILVVCIRVFQQFTGASAIYSYSQVLILQTTNLSPVMGSIVMQSLAIIMYIPTYFLIERLGRRILILSSVTLTFVVLLSLSIYFTLKELIGLDMTGLDLLPVFLMTCFVCTFGLGSGVVVSVLISEVFSSSIKSKALGLSSIIYAGSIMSSIKMYQFTADNLYTAVPFYIFTMFTFVNILFTYFFIPETKGKTLEMIQMELRKEKISL